MLTKMKLLIQTIFLLFSVACIGQTQKTTTIKLATGDSRTNQAYSWHGADTIIFYKLPEDTIVFKVIPRQYRQFPIKLENIPIAEYRLAYKNNYKQLVNKQIELTDQESNSITLYPDSLLEYSQNTLAKFQDKDIISINFHSQGCFHTTLLKIIITKEGENFAAKLCNVSWYYAKKKGKTTMQYRGDSTLQTVTLTNKNLQDFIRFENEINFAYDGGCTTTDWYDIKSKYLNIKKTDGSCSWDGFYYLRKSFFGDEK
jgi:hypothetical protein